MKINTICKDCSRNLQICTCMDDTIVPIKEFTIDELLKEYGKNLTESEVKLLTIKKDGVYEISDEEINQAAPMGNPTLEEGFVRGAKWYREQLKQRQ
jgi:hypothetical protein